MSDVDWNYESETDCPYCSTTLDAADLCEHEDPLCPACCTRDHVRTWERIAITERKPAMTLHIYCEIAQGSDEWHDQRRGIVTASAVGKLLTDTGRVANNDTSRGFTATLVAERITGWTEDTPMNSDMWRGVESEPYARDLYSEHFAPVTEVGFMLRTEENWQLGYSPDGLVGDDGLIEIKAPRAKTHLKTILADEVPAQYMAQCQSGLLVSGRQWIDFVSYVGGMPLFVKRVLPDPKWQDAITAACIAFEAAAAEIVADYRKRVAGMPKTKRLDFELKVA